jgi:hypothetical protein
VIRRSAVYKNYFKLQFAFKALLHSDLNYSMTDTIQYLNMLKLNRMAYNYIKLKSKLFYLSQNALKCLFVHLK